MIIYRKNKFRHTESFLILTAVAALFLLSGCASLVSGDTEGRAVLPDDSEHTALEYAGTVTASLTSWNWFYSIPAEQRRAELEKLALKLAVEQFGVEAVIKPGTIIGKWDPASLLMILGTAGFVENSTLEASVWLPAPPPAPEPELKKAVRYSVIPAAEYTTVMEFTTVEYRTAGQLSEQLEEAFASGKISEDELRKKNKELPPGGRIIVTYGRSELTNAISRWFNFTLNNNGEQVFSKRGIEDIPYVYGNDKLWWNDRSFNINHNWSDSLDFKIEDRFQKKAYNFKIIREEYIVE